MVDAYFYVHLPGLLRTSACAYSVALPDVEIIDPKSDEERERRESFGQAFFEKRKRKGFTEFEAIQIMRERNHFGAMMVEIEEALDD